MDEAVSAEFDQACSVVLGGLQGSQSDGSESSVVGTEGSGADVAGAVVDFNVDAAVSESTVSEEEGSEGSEGSAGSLEGIAVDLRVDAADTRQIFMQREARVSVGCLAEAAVDLNVDDAGFSSSNASPVPSGDERSDDDDSSESEEDLSKMFDDFMRLH
jgi:hypothetical protein